MKKRTKHGHSGQSTDRSAAVWASRWREVASTASKRQSLCFPAGGTFPDSRAVRALSGVTVLCPFLHEQMSPTRRVRSLRARYWRCLGAITISDAVQQLRALRSPDRQGRTQPGPPKHYAHIPPSATSASPVHGVPDRQPDALTRPLLPRRRHRSDGRRRQLRDGSPQLGQLGRDDVVQLADRRNELPLRFLEGALLRFRWHGRRRLEPA